MAGYTKQTRQEIIEEVKLAEKRILSKTGLRVKVTYAVMIDKAEYDVDAYAFIVLVSKTMNVQLSDMMKKSRKGPIVLARQVCTRLFVEFRPDLSHGDIGRLFGGLDRTSVLHMVQKTAAFIKNEDAMFLPAYFKCLSAVNKMLLKLPEQNGNVREVIPGNVVKKVA